MKPRMTCMPTRIATSSTSKLTGITSPEAARGTAHQRGYGNKWRVARLEWLVLHPICEFCGMIPLLDFSNMVVDHKIPHRGNQQLFWSRTNWQTLCRSCHSSTKQAAEYGL